MTSSIIDFVLFFKIFRGCEAEESGCRMRGGGRGFEKQKRIPDTQGRCPRTENSSGTKGNYTENEIQHTIWYDRVVDHCGWSIFVEVKGQNGVKKRERAIKTHLIWPLIDTIFQPPQNFLNSDYSLIPCSITTILRNLK